MSDINIKMCFLRVSLITRNASHKTVTCRKYCAFLLKFCIIIGFIAIQPYAIQAVFPIKNDRYV